MNDRPDRSYWGFWACFVQSFFAFVIVMLYSLLVYIGGAGIFGDAPFRFGNAFEIAVFFILPVAGVVASAIFLWGRNKVGWYLTIGMNFLFEAFFIFEFIHLHTPRTHASQTRVEAFVHLVRGLILFRPPIILTLEQLVLLAPPIFLALPEVRHEYLAPRMLGSLTESEQV